MQHQAPGAIRACLNYGGADDTAQAGGDRGREHQEPHSRCERQVQTCLPGCLVGPATGTVHYAVGLVLRTCGDADAGHTIAGHDQVYDRGAADDLRAMAKLRGGKHGMRVNHRIEPTLFREKRHRRIADCRRIDVGLQFPHLAQRDPLRGIAPGPQLLDIFTLRRAIRFGFPFQTTAAMPPWRGAELVGQRGMRLHAGDIQIVIGLRRFVVRVGPGETNARSAPAHARRFQHRNSRAGLSQPICDRGAHHAGTNYYRLNHLRLRSLKTDYGTRLSASPENLSPAGRYSNIRLRFWRAPAPALSRKLAREPAAYRVGCRHGSALLPPPSLPARDHPARDLAPSPLNPELPRCRGAAGRTRARHLLRNGAALRAEVRSRDRAMPASA